MKIKEIRDIVQEAKKNDPQGYEMVIAVLDSMIDNTPETVLHYPRQSVLAVEVLFDRFKKEEGGLKFVKELLTKESVITTEINKAAVDALGLDEVDNE